MLEHAGLGAGSPLSVTKLENRHFSTKMSFMLLMQFYTAVMNTCLDSGPSRRHVLCEALEGNYTHDALAKKISTLRTENAAPRRDNVALSLRPFEIAPVLQCNSQRIGPF